jgi:uncharacterized protein YkwD
VVAVEFQGDTSTNTSSQQVAVFIDGESVGSAASGNPLFYAVSPGSHTVTCSDVSGYESLGVATLTIAVGQEAEVTCVYTPIDSETTTTATTTAVTATSASSTVTTITVITTTTPATSTTVATAYSSSTSTTTSVSTSSYETTTGAIPNPSFQNGTADIWYPPDSSALASYAQSLINNDRESNGVAPLSLSTIPSGQQHADSMLYFGYFSHEDPQGYGPAQRWELLGGGAGYIGENIGLGYCNDSPVNSTEIYPVACNTQTIDNAVANLEWAMMYNDETCCNNGHRLNILDPSYTQVSIGIVYNGSNDAVYFVEDFWGP